LINIPHCCENNPYGYIELKIENHSTKIPLCKKHYILHIENYDEEVSISSYVLDKGEKFSENNEAGKLVVTGANNIEDMIEDLLLLIPESKFRKNGKKTIVDVIGTIEFDFDEQKTITTLEVNTK